MPKVLNLKKIPVVIIMYVKSTIKQNKYYAISPYLRFRPIKHEECLEKRKNNSF
jgi:hypothetical protein